MQIDYKKYIDEIKEMVKTDQELRSAGNINWDKVTEIDRKHTFRMREIVDEIGFPTISKIGKQANADSWLLIQHSPDIGLMQEYLALMEKQNDDEYQKMHYAYLKDRILLYEKKPQIYGTQVVMDDKTNKFKLWDVENEAELNERRKKIGLEPIEEYLKNFE